MNSNIKIMVLGNSILFLGFYLGLLFIDWIGFIILIIGCCFILYGFFAEDRQDDRLDELYALLLKLRDNSAKTVTCKKCGEEYKDLYNSCPKCGYNGHSESK